MSKKFANREANNPFSTQAVDAALYGKVDDMPEMPAAQRVVAKPLDIMKIRADVRQPRRAIPAPLRLHWDGTAAQVRHLLTGWHSTAEKELGDRLDVVAIVNGMGEGVAGDDLPPLVEDFVALARLASSIRAEGLINPPTVVEQGGGQYLIESGERRWLAYHMLYIWHDAAFQFMPARVSDGKDFLWRQAQENTARRALNAIGMARQLALLIMDLRKGIDGTVYDPYEQMIFPGECDRKFYAQVSNGNIHRIPRGMGEKIIGAMGFVRKSTLAEYRQLLTIPDDVWTRADVENWALGRIQKHMGWKYAEPDTFDMSNVSPQNPSPLTPLPSIGEGNKPAPTWGQTTAKDTPPLAPPHSNGEGNKPHTFEISKVAPSSSNYPMPVFNPERAAQSIFGDEDESSDNAPSVMPAKHWRDGVPVADDATRNLLMAIAAFLRANGKNAEAVEELVKLTHEQCGVMPQAIAGILELAYQDVTATFDVAHSQFVEYLKQVEQILK